MANPTISGTPAASRTGTGTPAVLEEGWLSKHWKKCASGIGFLVAASLIPSSIVQNITNQWEEPRKERDKDMINKLTKIDPTNPEEVRTNHDAIAARRAHTNKAAQYVDTYLSWRASPDGDPAKAVPSPTIKELEALASLLGKGEAFKKFVAESRYHWTDKDTELFKQKSVAKLPAGTMQNLKVQRLMQVLDNLFNEFEKSPNFTTANVARYPLVRQMMGENGQAYRHARTGLGHNTP